MEYTLIGRKERLRNLALPPPLPNQEQSEAATISFPTWEQQGVNQSGFTKYLCQAFI